MDQTRTSLLTQCRSQAIGGAIGTALALAMALLFLAPGRLTKGLVRASYDRAFDLASVSRPDIQKSGVVIIYMDEPSYRILGQSLSLPWDRGRHAELLDRLTADEARCVIFDAVFGERGPDREADRRFAEAVRRNGRVILAADYTYSPTEQANPDGTAWSLTPPASVFREVAAGWGLALLKPDEDFTMRRHFHGTPETPSLVWAAAKHLDLHVTHQPGAQQVERWVNYYGGPETVPHVSYGRVLSKDGIKAGFFRNKIVFIGARPITTPFLERRDELRVPFFSWGREYQFMPAVEVHATEMLNLLRNDWLRRPPLPLELAIFGLTAVLAGFGLIRFRPLIATCLAVTGALVAVIVSGAFFGNERIWFPWMVVVGAQIPVGLLWSVIFKSFDWYAQRRRLEYERRVADEQIREQAALLDKAQDAIIAHDLDWRATFWNQSAERLYGWKAAEVLEQSLENFILNGEPAKLAEARQTVLETGEWNGELNQKTREGRHVLVQSRWSLVRDDQNRPRTILVINTDITEKKKLESQFLRAQRLESIGTLASGIAHDLNNVLSPIVIGAHLLDEKLPDEYSRALLRTMSENAERGAAMVKQVLTFARGHDGDKLPLHLESVIKGMRRIAADTFPKSIQTEVDIPDGLWTVLGDPTQWHQVLLNLCVNARDAMPEGGTLRLSARNVSFDEKDANRFLGARPIDYVHLSVSDTGTGIPPEILDKIFEPFFTTKEVGKGTGLGLSTVSSIVHNHHGLLEVASEPGRGTTFDIYIPALRQATVEPALAIRQPSYRGRGELVLVVDDEPALLQAIRATLTSAGYRVLTASHGKEAVAICAGVKEQIAVAIIDMMMPVMDGPKTIWALKNLRPEVRFIAVSGLPAGEKVRDKLQDLVFAYLAKPITPEKLLKTVHEVLGEQPASILVPAG
jgi:two-component system, cell cycle sensor histidine kinase and response regulator CckA